MKIFILTLLWMFSLVTVQSEIPVVIVLRIIALLYLAICFLKQINDTHGT